jgi:hypothetical protein
MKIASENSETDLAKRVALQGRGRNAKSVRQLVVDERTAHPSLDIYAA